MVFGILSMVFGKVIVETPKFQLLKSTIEYEIRKYPPSVLAQITYDPSQMGGNRDGGFSILASYIGVTGKPKNIRPEKIAMTAPVITATENSETISMTAPVITSKEDSEKISMTTPVVTSEEGNEKSKMVTMQFVLPSKYTKAEEAPKPTDERIVIKEVGEKVYGVMRFSGVASDSVVENKVEKLKSALERDGHKVIGKFLLARYNPPWLTLPPLRTNEMMIPIELRQI